MELAATQTEFEKKTEYLRRPAERVAQLSLVLGRIAMDFASIERVPRYEDGRRENDSEHSFMLGLVAPEIAAALELPLDQGLISRFALVHDLVEIKTGDMATFQVSRDEEIAKEQHERLAMEELLSELPPLTAHLLQRYEAQLEPEARFVRYIDKLLPVVVDIIGQGERMMAEYYGVGSPEELELCHRELHERIVQKFRHEFPELDLAHKILLELFEAKYASSAQSVSSDPHPASVVHMLL